MVLEIQTTELRLIRSHSLLKEALRRCKQETDLLEKTRAPFWLQALSKGIDSSFARCRPTWNLWNRWTNLEVVTQWYGLYLSTQYCAWSFLDVTYSCMGNQNSLPLCNIYLIYKWNWNFRIYLLQEISGAFTLRAMKATRLEEVEYVFAGALVDNLTLAQQDDVIKELKDLRSRLEERHEDGGLTKVDDLLQAFDDLEGGGAIKTS